MAGLRSDVPWCRAGRGGQLGLAAMLVAAVTALPLAPLYERGGARIWAPALLHAAIDTIRVVVVEPAMTFSLHVVAVALVVPAVGVPIGGCRP